MNINKSEQLKLSRSKRVLLVLIGIALALTLFAIFFIEALLFIGTPFLLDCFASLSVVVLAFILPYFSYKLSSTPFKILVLWFILMAAGIPIISPFYYRTIAAKLVVHSVSNMLVDVKYVPFKNILDGGPYMTYSYQTANQKQDYETMKGLYIAKFRTWNKFEDSQGGKSYISFTKVINTPPDVTLVIDEKTPELIEVGVSF